MTTHRYTSTVRWEGSTGLGYRAYPRSHTATVAGATLTLSASAAFRGDAEHPDPEELLVAAASSCQLLSFLAVAARHGVDVLAYDDRSEGFMDDSERPVRVGRIVLRPVITVAAGTPPEEVVELAHLAHDECYVAHSLSGAVELEVTAVGA